MIVVSRTHKGNVRPTNQDALLLQEGAFGLFGVADGMGGHNAGDVASRMAVLLLGRVLEGAKPSEELLRGGIEEVNLMIYEEQKKEKSLSGMGTTMTVVWEDEKDVFLGHVGDSRCYLLREGKIRQLSQDHSMVAELLRKGQITREEADRHPYRNIITRALGAGDTVEVDTMSLPKKRGDKFLICSDGLYEYVSDAEMESILLRTPLEEAADQFLAMALEGGGRDNVSVLIAEVTA